MTHMTKPVDGPAPRSRSAVFAVRPALGLAVALPLACCTGIRVESELAHAREPLRLTSYAWLEDPASVSGPLDTSLRGAVDRQFASLGIERRSPDTADVLVRYRSDVEFEVRDKDRYFSFARLPPAPPRRPAPARRQVSARPN